MSAVAAGVAIGWQNISCFDNWDSTGLHWHPLLAAAGQLAAGTAMVALITAPARKAASAADIADGTADDPGDEPDPAVLPPDA